MKKIFNIKQINLLKLLLNFLLVIFSYCAGIFANNNLLFFLILNILYFFCFFFIIVLYVKNRKNISFVKERQNVPFVVNLILYVLVPIIVFGIISTIIAFSLNKPDLMFVNFKHLIFALANFLMLFLETYFIEFDSIYYFGEKNE